MDSVFPPRPAFTVANLPDQKGKVFIVTGSSGGLGKELAEILYQQNAKVYIAARSETKAKNAIKEMHTSHPDSKGELQYLHLDLSDLSTIKESTQEFLQRESRLDVLWNNAGVMLPPEGFKTAQGYELQQGVNNLGSFLLTYFLRPILVATAKHAPKNSVRVIWVSSGAVMLELKTAIDFTNMNYKREESAMTKYRRSKAGNAVHAAELARRVADEGILSLKLIASNAKNGAYTELFAGLSPDITEKNNRDWVAPFGRLAEVRHDLLEEELGRKYWEWTEEQVKEYF